MITPTETTQIDIQYYYQSWELDKLLSKRNTIIPDVYFLSFQLLFYCLLKVGRMASDFEVQLIKTEEELRYTTQVTDGPQLAMILGTQMTAK
jgi:hypothetical protein